MTCDRCGHVLAIGDYPFCRGAAADHQGGTFNVISDDIPGGVLMPHGICHDDGTPKRYYSHSEMARAAKAKGLINRVQHVPERGSDKSPFTTRWI